MTSQTRRPTVADLRALKGKRQIITLHVDSEAEAEAAAEAGIEMFTCLTACLRCRRVKPIWSG